MKHTAVVLSEQNINQIAGRLRKFFHCGSTRGTYIFSNYHNFDNRWSSSRYNDFPYYYHTPEISVKDFGISLVYGVGVGASYEFSTWFKFYGSTLKIQSSWVGKENYIYETFTVIPHPLVPQLMKADQDSKDDFYGYCDDDYGDAIYDDFDER